jgi:hypothetical protein
LNLRFRCCRDADDVVTVGMDNAPGSLPGMRFYTLLRLKGVENPCIRTL